MPRSTGEVLKCHVNDLADEKHWGWNHNAARLFQTLIILDTLLCSSRLQSHNKSHQKPVTKTFKKFKTNVSQTARMYHQEEKSVFCIFVHQQLDCDAS